MGNQQITPTHRSTANKQISDKVNASQQKNNQQPLFRPAKLPPLKPTQLSSPPSRLKRSITSSQSSRLKINSLSRSKLKRKNSNEILQMAQNLEQQNNLSPQQLDNIYFISEANLDKFLNNLQQPLSKLYTQLSRHTLTYMSNKFSLTKQQATLFLSQKMLKTNLNILKTLGQKVNHQFNQSIFKNFNQLQKSIIGYLKAKYPRGQQNFVSGDLLKVFKSFNYIESPQNDIIRKAGFYFKKQHTRDLLKMIKQFLNSVIDEVDLNFPRFQKMFQDKIFKIGKKQDKSLAYRIGRKLPQTISKFTAINSNSLDIQSPQLFRVIMKWVNDMQQFLVNPDEQIDQKQTFKVINQQDDYKYYVDQITKQEYVSNIQELKLKLKQEKINYQTQIHDLITGLYKFQHNLIKIVQQGQLSERYVPRNDAQIIKFAAYNTKFMSWMLAQKLTIVMKKLIKVGRYFKNTTLMVPLDLIKFNVTDMLRAMLVGTKSQILQVYSNLKKLQVQEQIKIIRLQNRLSTTQNDIVINFKLKNCFLICQLNLVLSESSHSSNLKLKNMEILNQFFTQLQASPYGVASQLAEYVGYKDSKVGYQKKVNFISKQFGISMCQLRHPAKINTIKQQYEPFICTSCSRFYGRLQNTFIMKQCKNCNNFLCSKCIFAKNSSLQSSYLKEKIIDYLNYQVSIVVENTRGKTQGSFQGITGGLIYDKLFQKFSYIKQIQKQRKLKKMTITQFESYIDSIKLERFVYGIYDKGQIILISCKYNTQLKQLSFGLTPQEDFYLSKKIGYRQSDFILIYSSLPVAVIDSFMFEKLPYINIFQDQQKVKKGKYQSLKINEAMILIGFTMEQNEQKIINNGQQQVQQAFYSQNKKQFKFDSLKTYFEYQGIGQNIRRTIKLQDIGIDKKHLIYFNTLAWADQIVEMNLSKNKISDISELLKKLPNIQRFIAVQNYIQNLTLPIKFNNLNSLILKRNLIKTIANIQNAPNLEKLNLQQNRIEVFPISTLKKLRNFNISQNYYLTKLDFIQLSSFPQLSYLNLQNSMQNIQYSDDNQQHRFIMIPYTRLKCFIVNNLKTNRVQFTSEILERIQISNCLISEVSGRFSNLQYFLADGSKFKDMSLIFRANNQNNVIKQVQLQSNLITEIPPKLNSKSLRKLNISSNSIIDISSLSQYILPQLDTLSLDYNQFKILPKLFFQKLSSLSFQVSCIENIKDFAKSQLPLVKNITFNVEKPLKQWPKFNFPKVTDLTLPSLQYPEFFEEFQNSSLPSLTNLTIQTVKLKNFPVINFTQLQSLRILFSTIQGLDCLQNCNLKNLKRFELNDINPQPFSEEQKPPVQDLSTFKISLPNDLEKLQEINLTSCRFLNIQNILTRTYKNLKTIMILYSNLSILPKLTLPKLTGLYLSSNQIKDISLFCDSDLPALEDLDLTNNKIEQIKQMRFKSLQILTMSNNSMTSMKNIQLPNLVRIDFALNKMQQFPIIWAQKLTDIFFDSNPLKSFALMQKCTFPSLKNLAFTSIQLQQQNSLLPKFQMPNIQSLSLYSINFTQISNINSLNKLGSLSLQSCSKIKRFPVLNLPQLKILDIKVCQFESWNGLWQSKIQNLVTFLIGWTNIQKFGGLHCPNLMQLNVMSNQKLINVEELFTTNKFNQLQTIYFNGNNNLSIQSQLNLPVIKKIVLNCIKISSIRLIGHSDRLTQLSVSESNFQELDLRQFKKLQTFEAINSHIQYIDKFCTLQWKFIKSINLTQNQIKNLPSFTKFIGLQTLFLNQNQIQNCSQFLQKSIFPSLIYLNLSINKIKLIKSIKNMPKLATLQLQFNQIEDIGFINNLQNVNPYINTIYLSNNKIKKVPIIKLGVQILNLSDNLIEDISFIEKSQLSRLFYLQLSRNKIKKLVNIGKLSKLANLMLQGNAIQGYEQFFMKSKLPVSIGYIGMSVVNTQQKIQQDITRYQQKYPNVGISLTRYEVQSMTVQN